MSSKSSNSANKSVVGSKIQFNESYKNEIFSECVRIVSSANRIIDEIYENEDRNENEVKNNLDHSGDLIDKRTSSRDQNMKDYIKLIKESVGKIEVMWK